MSHIDCYILTTHPTIRHAPPTVYCKLEFPCPLAKPRSKVEIISDFQVLNLKNEKPLQDAARARWLQNPGNGFIFFAWILSSTGDGIQHVFTFLIVEMVRGMHFWFFILTIRFWHSFIASLYLRRGVASTGGRLPAVSQPCQADTLLSENDRSETWMTQNRAAGQVMRKSPLDQMEPGSTLYLLNCKRWTQPFFEVEFGHMR